MEGYANLNHGCSVLPPFPVYFAFILEIDAKYLVFIVTWGSVFINVDLTSFR